MISIALSKNKAQLAEAMPNVWRYLEGRTQLEAFYERYQREGIIMQRLKESTVKSQE